MQTCCNHNLVRSSVWRLSGGLILLTVRAAIDSPGYPQVTPREVYVAKARAIELATRVDTPPVVLNTR